MTDNSAQVTSGSGTFPLEKADHAMGLELQIVELVEQQARARVQHRNQDAEALEDEIGELRAELAATAEFSISG